MILSAPLARGDRQPVRPLWARSMTALERAHLICALRRRKRGQRQIGLQALLPRGQQGHAGQLQIQVLQHGVGRAGGRAGQLGGGDGLDGRFYALRGEDCLGEAKPGGFALTGGVVNAGELLQPGIVLSRVA